MRVCVCVCVCGSRLILHTLAGTCVWVNAAFCTTACNIPLSSAVQNTARINTSSHAVAHFGDTFEHRHTILHNLPESVRHVWFWVPDRLLPSFAVTFPAFCPVAAVHRNVRGPVHLYCSPGALSHVSDIQCLRLSLALAEFGTSELPDITPHNATGICKALTAQISTALQERNLGKWGQLVQERTKYLPFRYSKSLREIRRLAFTDIWHVCCTPPAFCIYIVYHLYLSVVYVGVTTSAPIKRLRKHMTDSLAQADAATLHEVMAKGRLEDWGIAPVEYVTDSWWASVRERDWWYAFRRWALNDVAPGIVDKGHQGQNRGWLNLKVLRLLKEIREAQDSGDHARSKFLHTELTQLGRDLSIPIHVAGNVVVPNLTPDQKTAIFRVARKVIKTTNTKAWEKQALMKLVKVVRSCPHNTATEFSRKARAAETRQSQGACTCGQLRDPEQFGAVRWIDGHLALIPVQIQDLKGVALRPRDPLPVTGRRARRCAVRALSTFADQVQGKLPDLDVYLPDFLFPERGNLLFSVRRKVETIADHLVVRIVDKGTGELWGFCRHWLWKTTEEFLRKENYIPSDATPEQVTSEIAKLVSSKGWNTNSKARMCALYIIGKAKSLIKLQWLWRPIAAYPEPQIRKRDLRTAARAYTCFLGHLIREIPNSFQVLRIHEVADWVAWANRKGLHCVAELDCKEQFNKVRPEWISTHLEQGIAFLSKRKRWRMKEVMWSVHHSTAGLDRAGMGTSKSFRYISHDRLSSYVSFELQVNNKCWSVGKVWSRDQCIPMGGSFSAQSADLHCVWSGYTGRSIFRRLGALNIAPEGYVFWVGTWTIALCQFRDNVLLATDASPDDCIAVVSLVRGVLEEAWGLPVECACADQQGDCSGSCLQRVVRCMGFCIAMGGKDGGICHVQPAALKDDWSLRLGPSLMTPGHSYKGYLAGIFTGALVNGRKWTASWAGQILSCLAWVQTALHAGYARGDTMRHMHRAVHRAYADSPHNVLGTVKAVHGLSYLLPARKCAVVEALQAWLVKKASREGDRYTSWAPRGHAALRAYDTVWNHDWEALQNLKAQCCPGAGCVCVSPR